MLEYCAIVYIKELLKCIVVFQHCRFSQDKGKGERNGGSGGASTHHLSLMPVDNRFQHSTFATRLRLSRSFPSTFKRSDLPKLKRYKVVGILARQIAVQSQTTVLWRWLTVSHLQYNILAQNCYSSWFDIPVDFLFLFSFIGWLDASQEAAVLVDPLEALRVLHSHEEFLSQVLK